jgi:predicted HTH transcriptional regulator
MRFYPKYIQGWESLEAMVAEGEHGEQDFKQSVPGQEKIARTLSAFANGKGGRLLVGINDKGQIIGADVEQEMYELFQAAEHCCDPPIDLEFVVHEHEGLEVLEAKVLRSLRKPHAAPDEKGIWQLYVRNGDQTMLAGVSLSRDFSACMLSNSDREKIMRYVRNHGSVKPEEVAEMLACSRKLASDYLEMLMSEAVLEVRERRGQKYYVAR